MLQEIPIYRILFDPHSYLLINNPELSTALLLEQLPNSKNESHGSNILGKDKEQVEKYYEGRLLVETKKYCRELLTRSRKLTDEYDRILMNNDLEKIFQIIIRFQLLFFKILIFEDLKNCQLFKGRIKEEIEKANNIETIYKSLRKYGVYSKLVRCIKDNYNKF